MIYKLTVYQILKTIHFSKVILKTLIFVSVCVMLIWVKLFKRNS